MYCLEVCFHILFGSSGKTACLKRNPGRAYWTLHLISDDYFTNKYPTRGGPQQTWSQHIPDWCDDLWTKSILDTPKENEPKRWPSNEIGVSCMFPHDIIHVFSWVNPHVGSLNHMFMSLQAPFLPGYKHGEIMVESPCFMVRLAFSHQLPTSNLLLKLLLGHLFRQHLSSVREIYRKATQEWFYPII